MGLGRRSFKLPWRSRAHIARDVDTELAFHLDMRIAELRARGMGDGEARQQAAREFGDLEFTRTYCREQDESAERRERLADRLIDWRQDIGYAVRTLRRSPAFAVVSMLTLAIAIGANTAVFTVSRAVLLHPLPYEDADRLYRIQSTWPGGPSDEVPLSPADFADIARAQTVFTGLAALSLQTPITWSPESGDPKSLNALTVGSNMFSVLGTRALHGRTLLPGDEVAGNDHKVVLSYDAWQRDFGGDPRIVDHPILLNGASYLVVGVMPRGFLIGRSEDVWIPYDEAGTIADVVRARKQHYIVAVGRLRRDATPARALGVLRTITARLAQQYPDADSARSSSMRPMREAVTGNLRSPLLLLQAAAALVLLIACANLANLALSRTTGRRRELATRAALGASRARLVRQLVTESVLLSLVGGALGVVLAVAGTRWLLSLNRTVLPPMFDAHVNVQVLAFSVVASLVAGVSFGLLPALGASSGALHESLKDGGRGGSGSRGSARVRRTLVMAQMSLALMLLTGAGLLVRSFARLTHVTLGYDPDGVITADVRAAGNRYDDPARINALYEGVIDRLSSTPGIVAAGATSSLPTQGGPSTSLRIEGEPTDEARLPELFYLGVRGEFFKTMRIPIIAGRAYDASDRPDRPETVILNETAAKRFFANGDAVGRRIRIGPDPNGAWMTIVGIAGDIHSNTLDSPVVPTMYANHRREPWMRSMSLVVRTSVSAANAGALIQRAVHAEDPTLAVSTARTLDDVMGASLASRRFALGLAMSFALIALVLAAVGLYGVLAYNVADRTRELGVRIALGASSRRVVVLVVRQGLTTSLAGIVVGLAGGMLCAQLLRRMLFGITPLDAATYVAAAALLLLVAIVACMVPAWRATRVDPLTTIRAD